MATKKRAEVKKKATAKASQTSLESVIASIDPRRGERPWDELLKIECPDLYVEMVVTVQAWARGEKFQGYTKHKISEAVREWLPEKYRRQPQATVKVIQRIAADAGNHK